MIPSSEFKVEASSDTDFVGLYGCEESNNPTCTNSRTGFLFNVFDCLVFVDLQVTTRNDFVHHGSRDQYPGTLLP